MRRDAAAIVSTAIRACDAGVLVRRALETSPPPSTSLNVIAAGKAARPMLDAFTRAHGDRVRGTVLAAGAHPVPDEASVDEGRRALALARAAAERDEPVVVLLSGGASSMMAVPAAGVMLADLQAVTRGLLRSGLPIAGMNAIRKHLSAIAGGQLGVMARRSITYAISDVHAPVEDDASVIGSGPTVGDASTFAEAVEAARSSGLLDGMAAAARERLFAGVRGEIAETPKPGDERLARSQFVVAGNRRSAMHAAAAEARARGYHVVIVDAPIVGEAREASSAFVARARAVPEGEPLALVGGGETTVTLGDDRAGRGGRNQEFALAAVRALAAFGRPAILVSAGTDGIDGPTDAAGAFAADTTLARATTAGLDADRALRAHASYDFFARLDDLLITGPTGTNVGDLALLLRS